MNLPRPGTTDHFVWVTMTDQMPEKAAQMKEIFLIEATKNKGLPIGGALFIPIFHPELRIQPPNT
jgi:hypothetical protein